MNFTKCDLIFLIFLKLLLLKNIVFWKEIMNKDNCEY